MANLKKTKEVKVKTKNDKDYSYRYTELSDINDYAERIGETYYQFIKRIDTDDYVFTKRIGEKAPEEALQGCRVVQAPINNEYSNPAQEQGSALTYARRYSLLMAYGLATEDDDTASLNKSKEPTIEEARNYKLTFGIHKGESLGDLFDDEDSYIDWLLENATTPIIKTYIGLLMSENAENPTVEKEDIQKYAKLKSEFDKYVIKGNMDLPKLLAYYKVKDSIELTVEQLTDAIKKMAEKLEPQTEKEVF